MKIGANDIFKVKRTKNSVSPDYHKYLLSARPAEENLAPQVKQIFAPL